MLGPRHGRDCGRGDAPRRLRFRRETAVADQAAAHRGAGARRRTTQTPVGAHPWTRARGADRQESKVTQALREQVQQAAEQLIRRCCCSVNSDPDARPTRAFCTRYRARASKSRFSWSLPRSLGANPADAAVRQRTRRPCREVGALDQAAGGFAVL